jgi:single-stranded-DNA-specific exonuclease
MLEVSQYLHSNDVFDVPKIIVLSSENWHQGVIGIVASKISEYYYCPTILISIENDIGKGSGRSVGGLICLRPWKRQRIIF